MAKKINSQSENDIIQADSDSDKSSANEHRRAYGAGRELRRGNTIGAVAEGTPVNMPNIQNGKTEYEFETREINVDGTPIIDFINESSPGNTSEDDDKFAKYFDEQKIKRRPNTAYFTCTDFHQLSIPNSEPLDPDSPLFISLLLPSFSLGGENVPLLSNGDSSNAFVEINCQVVDVNVLPSGQIATPIQVMS